MSSLWRFLGLLSASSSRSDPFDFVFDTDLYTDAIVRCLWCGDFFLRISTWICAKTFAIQKDLSRAVIGFGARADRCIAAGAAGEAALPAAGSGCVAHVVLPEFSGTAPVDSDCPEDSEVPRCVANTYLRESITQRDTVLLIVLTRMSAVRCC
jgi:hypothetical protein